MLKCSEDCSPVCDFCVWYDYNSDKYGEYYGYGLCQHSNHINKPTDPSDYCENYECMNAEEANQEALKRHKENRVISEETLMKINYSNLLKKGDLLIHFKDGNENVIYHNGDEIIYSMDKITSEKLDILQQLKQWIIN